MPSRAARGAHCPMVAVVPALGRAQGRACPTSGLGIGASDVELSDPSYLHGTPWIDGMPFAAMWILTRMGASAEAQSMAAECRRSS